MILAAAQSPVPPVGTEAVGRGSQLGRAGQAGGPEIQATPLASAMWPRSASRPSLTSIIAVAPAAAAGGPAA